jgi:hypothetical protein
MSSFEKESPGIKPLFFNQKIAQNDPEKNIPSTAEKATHLSAKEAFSRSHHLRAHSAFFWTHGTVSMALKRYCFWSVSLM